MILPSVCLTGLCLEAWKAGTEEEGWSYRETDEWGGVWIEESRGPAGIVVTNGYDPKRISWAELKATYPENQNLIEQAEENLHSSESDNGALILLTFGFFISAFGAILFWPY